MKPRLFLLPTVGPPGPDHGTPEADKATRMPFFVKCVSRPDPGASRIARPPDRPRERTPHAGIYSTAMAKGLYLGKTFAPADASLGDVIRLDPSDLLTHGLIVGMTGSGKTGTAIALIEEVLRQGVPVLAIDPKGDLGDLLLLFDDLAPASFLPWIDPQAARRGGKDGAPAAPGAA